jgi:hypothetical protein
MEQSSKHAQPPELPLSALQRDCVEYLEAHADEIPCRVELPTCDDSSGTIFITFSENREEKHNYLYNPERGEWRPFQYLLPRHGVMPGLLALNKYGATQQVLSPHDGPSTNGISVHSPEELVDYIRFCRDAAGHVGLPEPNVGVPLEEIFARLGLPVRERTGHSFLDLTDPAVTSHFSSEAERDIFRTIHKSQMTDAGAWRQNASLLRPVWGRGDRTYLFAAGDKLDVFRTLQPRTDHGVSWPGLYAWVSYEKVSPLFLREYFLHTTEGQQTLAKILQADGFEALRRLLKTHRVSIPESLAVQRRKALEWHFTRGALMDACGRLRRRPRPVAEMLSDYQGLLALLRSEDAEKGKEVNG